MKLTTLSTVWSPIPPVSVGCVVPVIAPRHRMVQGTTVSAARLSKAITTGVATADLLGGTFAADAATNGYPGIRSWSPPV